MKAISPALPMTTPSRQSNGGDASAADEAFGALIAAVIGAPVTAPAPAPASDRPSSARINNADDARPAATRSASSTRAAADTADTAAGADAKANGSGDSAQSSRTEQPSASAQTAPAKSSVDQAPQAKSKPTTAGSTSPAVADASAQSKIPAGLAKAAAALAQALAASSGGTSKAPSNGLPAQGAAPAPSATKPGSALTEGQLPAQLVAAVTATHVVATTSATPATATAGLKAGDKPGLDAATKPVAPGDTKSAQPASVVTTAPAAPSTVQQPPAQQQLAQPQASSDVKPGGGAGSIAVSTATDHPKSAETKTGSSDRSTGGGATPHFDVQLSAQPLAPTSAPLVASANPAQAPQPAYASGLVSQQVVQVVAPLRTARDGNYSLSLQLHPADLGAVTVRVDVQQGVLSVHMSAEHAHGHDALNQSLADLRTQLQSSGVRTGDIVVATKPSFMSQHQDQQQHNGGRHPHEAPMYDDAGADRRPGDRPSQHTQSHVDDDTLDVRI